MNVYTEQAETEATLAEWLSDWGAGPETISRVSGADLAGITLSSDLGDLEAAIAVIEIALAIPRDWDWTR